MRVCIIRNADGYTNAQMERVATALSKTEHEYFYITRKRESVENETIIKEKIIAGGRQVTNYEIQLPLVKKGLVKKTLLNLKYSRILKKWLEDNQNRFDVIHAIDYDAGSIALNICKKYNKKFVYHIADFYADSRQGLPNVMKVMLRKSEYNVINQADATIICTEERKKQIVGSNPKQLVVIHNTPARAQKEGISFSGKENNEKLTLSYIGGLEKKRFIDQIITCTSARNEIRLNLAGPVGDAIDNPADLEKIENIHYYGKITYDEALNLNSKTDIMIAIYDPEHPNHKYSAPNKIYEAMLLGKAIIVAKDTGVDKIVEEEDMGYVIDFNQDSLLSTLAHIENNRDELIERSINAYNAYKKYSWELMQTRLIDLYKNL